MKAYFLDYHLTSKGGHYFNAENWEDAQHKAQELEPEYGETCEQCGDAKWWLTELDY